MKKLEKIISLLMLVFAVGFNLWLYRLEPSAKIDPNDNPFQYALVDRTNQMWDYAASKCSINPLCFTGYLIDHWVPNWAQGYNLPYYYSHAPQIGIVASYRLLGHFAGYSLFQWYHLLIYLLLCLFPISVFVAFRVLRVPPLIAGIAALLASQVSTDGLYGLDPSSFLWRGYGLTSQLFSMIWMPVAIAYSFQFFNQHIDNFAVLLPENIQRLGKKLLNLSITDKATSDTAIATRKTFWYAVLFLILTISGHLGLGVMTLLSIGILAMSKPIFSLLTEQSITTLIKDTKERIYKLVAVSGATLFFLSYFILPALVNDKYHNYSFWDPVWKFNSWGWKEVLQYFFNGALFDFGRFPVLTILILLGAFAIFSRRKKVAKIQSVKASTESINTTTTSLADFEFYPFSLLFAFWLLMFFGRTTWGGLLDLIPSMKEFHQSRFIVGVHLSGFFLAPLGLWYLVECIPSFLLTIRAIVTNGFSSLKSAHSYEISSSSKVILTSVLALLTIVVVYPQTMRYSDFNDVLIKRGNDNFEKQRKDVDTLISTLQKAPPGRVFTGRGGSWGKKLQIAETTYFMHLSTYGLPVILWLPETWSPNSDVEQFFIEDWKEHYDLMNVKYVVTPPDLEPQKFWKLLSQSPQWKLYEVETSGYFGSGSQAAVIYSSKFDYINVVRLWLQSDYVKKGIFPALTFKRNEMINSKLPAFEMIDEASYKTRDGNLYGLFGDIPKYEAPVAQVTTTRETSLKDMEFTSTVDIKDPCTQCIVFLKQSFHPNWHAWVDGKRTDTFVSFPFYTAVSLTTPGTHTVEFKYEPSTMKMVLFTLALAIGLFIVFPTKKFNK